MSFKNQSPIDSEHINTERIPHEARRVLVSLLRYGVILSDRKSKLYESLCRYQETVRNRLNDLYLDLVLDERAGVAFVASQNQTEDEEGDNEAVSLIGRRTLSLYDTLLLLVLRKFYQEREKTGEQKVMMDIERVETLLKPFLPLTNSTTADRKKLNGAMVKMSEKHLINIRGNENRFEITPLIRYVVKAEFLEKMLEEYLHLAEEFGVDIPEPGDKG